MKIVFTDADTVGNDVNLNLFASYGEFISYGHLSTQEEVYEKCKDADIVITNKSLFDAKMLKHLPNLKLICISATGYNNVDIDVATQLNVGVANVAGYSTNSVAQRTFTLVLALIEQIKFYDHYVKSGEYSNHYMMGYFERRFIEIANKRWGIIGMGNIGKKVAEIATAFGAEVVYYSSSGKNLNQPYTVMPLNELLKTSDIVSIHSPLNSNTKNLIAEKQLNLMKETAYLINVGRGGIVNEMDLANALNNNQIAGAGLDVMEVEPINADNPLLKLNNPDKIVMTPHNAWTSNESRSKLINEIALNIEAFQNNQLRNRIC